MTMCESHIYPKLYVFLLFHTVPTLSPRSAVSPSITSKVVLPLWLMLRHIYSLTLRKMKPGVYGTTCLLFTTYYYWCTSWQLSRSTSPHALAWTNKCDVVIGYRMANLFSFLIPHPVWSILVVTCSYFRCPALVVVAIIVTNAIICSEFHGVFYLFYFKFLFTKAEETSTSGCESVTLTWYFVTSQLLFCEVIVDWVRCPF